MKRKKFDHLNLCDYSNLFKLDYPARRIIKNIRCFKIRIKAMVQRAKYGVSQYDAWDFNYFIMVAMENGLKFLKDAGNSYPGWTSYEDWQRKLEYIIKLCEMSNFEESQITEKSFDKYLDYLEQYGKDSKETEDARKEWLEDELEKDKLQHKARHKALKELEKYIEDLWD